MVDSNVHTFLSPIGVAAGYGARQTYNDNSGTKNAVAGVLDAFSAGILLYTGLVEVSILLPGTSLAVTDLRKFIALGSRNLAQPENDEGVDRKTDIHLYMYASRQWSDGPAG